MVKEKTLYELFRITILTKAFFACADIIGSFLLYFFGSSALTTTIISIAQGELVDDPNSIFAELFLKGAHHLTADVTTFAALYLFVHGSINAVFLGGLWRDKRWAYPFAMVALSLFVLYQLHRLSISFSIWLAVLSLFDVFVIGLIWHEYRYRSTHHDTLALQQND